MKNLKYTLLGALALSMTVSSCKKSFLETSPTSNISTADEAAAVAQDPKLLGGRITGLYTTMYQTQTGGTTNHDDFGQKGYDIYSDMLCSDMVLGAVNYGWYSTLIRYTATKDNASNPVYEPFRYYYRIIFAANTAIDVLGGTDAVPTNTTLKYYMGQAKAMRAYAYLYLSNFYAAKGYGTGAEKTLPIYTSTKDLNKPAATSAEVYAQMEKDLTDAITLLTGFARTAKNQIDVNVAKGLLAYVYAGRGASADLTKVVTLTNDVLAVYPLTTSSQAVAQFGNTTKTGPVLNPESGFNNVATASWMWGADITLDSSLDLVSWWGQIDVFTYSYAWAGDPKFIDSGLYGTMTTGTAATNPHFSDIRKGQFFDYAPDPYGGLLPIGKFFDGARVEGGQRNVTDDYIYMRADEMQLLNAEANCKLGNDAAARTSLLKLVSLRYANATDLATYTAFLATQSGTAVGTSATTPVAPNSLLEEIYLQTRLELWGEGKTYLAMKRNKHYMVRGANHLFLAGSSYAYDAPETTLPIPSAEVLYNPNFNK